VCQALTLLKGKIDIPLVIIGNGKKEKDAVKDYINLNGLQKQVFFLNDLPVANDPGFVNSADFPAIYQQALALIYPSLFEGFGIPLLEAMWSKLPVISSDTSSLPEVLGEAGLYFSPENIEMLATHMHRIATDKLLVDTLKEKGLQQAQKFTASRHAEAVMNVYLNII